MPEPECWWKFSIKSFYVCIPWIPAICIFYYKINVCIFKMRKMTREETDDPNNQNRKYRCNTNDVKKIGGPAVSFSMQWVNIIKRSHWANKCCWRKLPSFPLNCCWFLPSPFSCFKESYFYHLYCTLRSHRGRVCILWHCLCALAFIISWCGIQWESAEGLICVLEYMYIKKLIFTKVA